MDLLTLSKYLTDEKECLQFFMMHNLIKSVHYCQYCGSLMVLAKKNANLNHFIWRCRIRKGTTPHDVEKGIYVGF